MFVGINKQLKTALTLNNRKQFLFLVSYRLKTKQPLYFTRNKLFNKKNYLCKNGD